MSPVRVGNNRLLYQRRKQFQIRFSYLRWSIVHM